MFGKKNRKIFMEIRMKFLIFFKNNLYNEFIKLHQNLNSYECIDKGYFKRYN